MPKSTSSSDRVLRSRSNSRESPSEICTAKSTRRKRTETVSLRAKFPWKPKGASEIRRSPRIMEEIREALAETMDELHLPFVKVPPTQDPTSSKVEAEVFNTLRCTTLQTTKELIGIWELMTPLKYAPLPVYAREDGPHWNLPPLEAPDRAVTSYLSHLRVKCAKTPKLQVPATWEPFAEVDWDHEPLLVLATSNSSDAIKKPLPFLHDEKLEIYKLYSQKPRQETAIRCRPRFIHHSRARRQWDLLYSMIPKHSIWRHQTAARAKQRVAYRRAGFLDQNQWSSNHDLWPQSAISNYLPIYCPRRDLYSPDFPLRMARLSESLGVTDIGRIITNMVAADAFPCQWRKKIVWPDVLSSGFQAPHVDYICQAIHEPLGRSQQVHPLLFAAIRFEKYCRREACKTLALAFQSMIKLFILYYLDTRSSQSDPMPEWMVLFGVVYDEEGLEVRACHPTFTPSTVGSIEAVHRWGTRDEGWGTVEVSICHNSTSIFEKPAWERVSLLEIFYRIQGHCKYVLERLKSWDGYDRVCEKLRSDI